MTSLRQTPTPSARPSDAAPVVRSDALRQMALNAAAGDLQQASQLLKAMAPRITSVVRVVMGRENPDVDDIVQQSLIAFLQALPAFRGECQPASYASRIAVRTAVHAKKRQRLNYSRQDGEADIETQVASTPNPSEQISAERRRIVVRDLLAELPEEQAEALALRVVLGWSLEDVATATHAPLNTVRSRIRLAKEALKKRIEADAGLLEELEVTP